MAGHWDRRTVGEWAAHWRWEASHWTDEAICPDCGGNGCTGCTNTGVIQQGHNPTWDREDKQ